MSVSLRKPYTVAADAEGLDVMLAAVPAGSWATNPERPFAFRVESVTAAPSDPATVVLDGEYLDEIGGAERFYVPAARVLALV